MKFRPNPLIRYFVRIAVPVWLIGCPGFIFYFICSLPGQPLVAKIFCALLFVGCAVLFWIIAWKKSYGTLTISDDGVLWKCPFYKSKFIPKCQVRQIGIEYENKNAFYARPIIYFSTFDYPEHMRNKITKLSRTEGFIQYMYDDPIGDYAIKCFPASVTYPLRAYQRKDKSKGKLLRYYFRH